MPIELNPNAPANAHREDLAEWLAVAAVERTPRPALAALALGEALMTQLCQRFAPHDAAELGAVMLRQSAARRDGNGQGPEPEVVHG